MRPGEDDNPREPRDLGPIFKSDMEDIPTYVSEIDFWILALSTPRKEHIDPPQRGRCAKARETIW